MEVKDACTLPCAHAVSTSRSHLRVAVEPIFMKEVKEHLGWYLAVACAEKVGAVPIRVDVQILGKERT